MGRLKRIVSWGLGLLFSSAVLIAVLLWVAGDGILSWAAQGLLEGAIDRKVHMDGTFSVDFGWEPGLIVTDVWIENSPWAAKKEMARVEHTEVQISLMPLFSGIVLLPRLVLEGLTIDLETAPDGETNWEFLTAGDKDRARPRKKTRVLPLLEFLSMKDVTVTHVDRRSGKNTEVILAHLRKASVRQDGSDDFASHEVHGEGSFNKTAFQIDGHFGSIEDALAAAAPFPLDLTLKTVGLVAEIKGTAQNLPKADGLDLSLTIVAPSVGQVLETLQSDLSLVGRADASAHLKGNLDSLAVEGLVVQVVGPAEQTLRAEGSLANLWTGEGLNLRLTGTLGPQALGLVDDRFGALGDILSGLTGVGIDGQITGKLRAPAFEKIQLRMTHGSGAELSLDGHGALELSSTGAALSGLDVIATLALPDPALLEQALESELPDLGAIQATAELSWAEGGLTLGSFTAKAESFGGLQLGGKGRIGGVTGKALGFELDPQLDLTASIERTQPLAALFGQPGTPNHAPPGGADSQLILLVQQGLFALGLHPGPTDGKTGPKTRAAIEAYQAKNGLTVDGRASEQLLARIQKDLKPDSRRAPSAPGGSEWGTSSFAEILPALGPVKASARLSGHQDGYRLDDLKVTLGAKAGLWIEAAGSLETLRFARQDPVGGLALTVNLALPSSTAFPKVFPPETPELKNLTGRFDVRGSPQALSISKAQFKAEGPDGLSATVTGQIAELALIPKFATKKLRLELAARSPDSTAVVRLFDLRLPELGAVKARAALMDHGDLFALSKIDVTAGDGTQPTAKITGEIGDLLAMKQVKLSGRFELPTAQLLAPSVQLEGSALGRLHGEFGLSDSDGTLGLDKLSAELVETKLLSLTLTGLFGDFAHHDDLRLQAELTVPNVGALGKELGIQADTLGAFSFTGQVSGSNDKILANGKARLGETEFSGTLSGDLAGARPVLSGKLDAPVFHFADFGLVPKTDEQDASEKQQAREQKAADRRQSADDPIPFDALKAFDLDLQVKLDNLEGVELDIDTAEAQLDLKDGVLKVDPFRLNFVGGHVTAQLVADARAATPKVTLSLEADNVDLGTLLSQVSVEVPLDGQTDVVLNLEAEGDSRQALTASLQGDVGMAVARGQISTSLLDLAAEDFTTWLFARSTRAGYSDLNCFIARFKIQNGLAKSEQLLLDTTNVLATGKGKIDLRDQTVDIKVDPQPKKSHLIDLTSPFEIQGPLASPEVKIGSTRTATRVVGEVILSPVRLLGSLLPFVGGSGTGTDHPCLDLASAAAGQ